MWGGNRNQRWFAREDQIIIDNPTTPIKVLAKALERSEAGVAMRRHALKKKSALNITN